MESGNLEDIKETELPVQSKGSKYLTLKSEDSVISVGRYWDDEEIYSLRNAETFEEIRRLQVPGESIPYYFSIVAPSNGLVCLNEPNLTTTYYSLNSFFWNPATRKFKVLPRFYINRFTGSVVVVGLGFAFVPQMNDYRVMRIVFLIKTKVREVEVYSLSTDSWKKVYANFQCHISSQLSQAFVNGSLHWLVRKKDEDGHTFYFILSFNMLEESFGKVMLPKCCLKDHFPSNKLLAIFRGCLLVLVYHPYHLKKNCDVWVMKEYGVAKSWTKQYTFRNEGEAMIPLGIFENGEIIMEREKMGSYFRMIQRLRQRKVSGFLSLLVL